MFFGLRRALAFVKRQKADRDMLILLVGFALTVALTRLFLELSGYPQLGNRELHVAHLLWGGLALYIGAILAIIYDHRHVYPIVAAFGGFGIGMFIDEIGKFITQSNDYFYPMAAPIIYGFFLLTLVAYLYIRRPLTPTPRGELYRAFELMKEALDHELDKDERAELVKLLSGVTQQTDDSNLSHVAAALLKIVTADELSVKSPELSVWQKLHARFRAFEDRWVPPALHKFLLCAGLLAASLFGSTELYSTSDLFLNTAPTAALYIAEEIFESVNQIYWFMFSVALDGLVGLALVVAALLLVFGRGRAAVTLGFVGLMFALTTANVLGVYFKQFTIGTMVETAVELGVLWILIRYRRRHLDESEA